MSSDEARATTDSNDHRHPPEAPAMVMYAEDAASQGLGMEIAEVGYGRATVTMTIRDDMVNGLDICHGGIIFALADSAMAFATNSYNRFAVATMAEIDWVRPGRKGAVLTAVAEQRHKRGRNAVTDVVVSDDAGQTIALFRGRTRQIEGHHLPERSGPSPAGRAPGAQ